MNLTQMNLRKLAPPKTAKQSYNINPTRIFFVKQDEKPKVDFEELVERQRDHNFLKRLIK